MSFVALTRTLRLRLRAAHGGRYTWILSETIVKRSNSQFLAVFILIFYVCESTSADNQEILLEFPYPEAKTVQNTNSFYCKAILGSKLEIVSVESSHLKKGIRGRLFKGTDEIAIRIENEKLHFLMRADLDSGITVDRNPFSIIYADNNQLVATESRRQDSSENIFVNVFSLSRYTGIAVWSKSRSNEVITKNPDVQSYVLKCESR